MSGFFRFLLLFLIAYFVVRLIGRLLLGVISRLKENVDSGGAAIRKTSERPKFEIEAEDVDFEIIDEPHKEDEK